MIKEIQNALDKGLLTELEAKVLNYVMDDFDVSDPFPKEFQHTAKILKMEFNTLKGVLGSLKKKKYVWVENYTSGGITDQWINADNRALELLGLSWED